MIATLLALLRHVLIVNLGSFTLFLRVEVEAEIVDSAVGGLVELTLSVCLIFFL